jgi:threonine dehydrogenase-like Zn-dependent dehydrogenase
MKAAVFYGKDDIRVENVKDPVLESEGIIIQIKACGICGSDLHPQDSWDRENGMILGHEFSGDVVEVGAAMVSGVPVPKKVPVSQEPEYHLSVSPEPPEAVSSIFGRPGS